jgi:ABC-type enterochelin transport system permease subunit
MRPATLAIAATAVIGLVVATALLFRMPLERAAVLAPVIVATVGATAFLVVLWARIAWESLRRQRHRGLIAAGLVGAFAVLAVVSFVLPRLT